MKFARRAEGIKAARGVFKMGREDARSRFHVFVAAAMMEYYSTKVRGSTILVYDVSQFSRFFLSQDKTVAFKIFELGLKKYGGHPEYILAYVNYMSHINGEILIYFWFNLLTWFLSQRIIIHEYCLSVYLVQDNCQWRNLSEHSMSVIGYFLLTVMFFQWNLEFVSGVWIGSWWLGEYFESGEKTSGCIWRCNYAGKSLNENIN